MITLKAISLYIENDDILPSGYYTFDSKGSFLYSENGQKWENGDDFLSESMAFKLSSIIKKVDFIAAKESIQDHLTIKFIKKDFTYE